MLAALSEPFLVAGTLLHVAGSIGITGLRPGNRVGRALAEADMAMYRAKTARTGFESTTIRRTAVPGTGWRWSRRCAWPWTVTS